MIRDIAKMTRKNRQHPPQEEPPLKEVRYIVTTAPQTSEPVDGYYTAFRDGFFFKIEKYLLRELQESKHRLLPTPLSSDEEVNTMVVSVPDIFGERYALPHERRRKQLQKRPLVAIYLQNIPDRLPEQIKKHFTSVGMRSQKGIGARLNFGYFAQKLD